MGEKVSAQEKAALKGQGFLPQRDGAHFAVRVITEDGTTTVEQTRALARIAELYGRGYQSYTTRLTVEIPWIRYEDILKVKAALEEAGLATGGTGPRVRPVVACKGTVCVFGLYDTQRLARIVHERFYEGYYDVKLPHKFKIGVGGCPNNCIKPDLNDFGILGQRAPVYDADVCRGCKKCGPSEACRVGVATLADGKLRIDSKKCNNCGLCIDRCPFGAVSAGRQGYRIFIGGKWGKAARRGHLLPELYDEAQLLRILETALLYYRENGRQGERFGDMIDRLGFETVAAALISGEALARKDAILGAKTQDAPSGAYSC